MAAPSRRDWELLGVDEGADRAAVDRAYRAAKACFAPDSLATYGLFEGDERERLEQRLDRAYLRITGDTAPPVLEASAIDEHLPADAETGPLPDRARSPGQYLRAVRERRGLTLDEIAHETKIRVWLLEQIEAEHHAKLPAPVYVRGFVIQVATLLGIDDPDELARSFLAALGR